MQDTPQAWELIFNWEASVLTQFSFTYPLFSLQFKFHAALILCGLICIPTECVKYVRQFYSLKRINYKTSTTLTLSASSRKMLRVEYDQGKRETVLQQWRLKWVKAQGNRILLQHSKRTSLRSCWTLISCISAICFIFTENAQIHFCSS